MMEQLGGQGGISPGDGPLLSSRASVSDVRHRCHERMARHSGKGSTQARESKSCPQSRGLGLRDARMTEARLAGNKILCADAVSESPAGRGATWLRRAWGLRADADDQKAARGASMKPCSCRRSTSPPRMADRAPTWRYSTRPPRTIEGLAEPRAGVCARPRKSPPKHAVCHRETSENRRVKSPIEPLLARHGGVVRGAVLVPLGRAPPPLAGISRSWRIVP